MKSIVILLFLFTPTALLAQWDAKVEAASKLMETQQYAKAIVELQDVMTHEKELDMNTSVRAHYLLADALLRESQRQVAIRGENVPAEYGDDVFEAAELLIKAKALSSATGTLASEIELRSSSVFNSLLMSAVQLTNSTAEVAAKDRQPYLMEMLRVCNMLVRLNPESYFGYDYRGQTHLMLADSAKAYSDLAEGIRLYREHPPVEPDAMACYMHYRLALLEQWYYHKPEKALEILKKGVGQLLVDRAKINADKVLSTERKQTILKKFDATENDLLLFQLEVLMNKDALADDELAIITKALQRQPQNVNLKLAYAEVIKMEKPDSALVLYDEVINADPKNATAYYNAGVVCYNMAASLSTKLSDDRGSTMNKEAKVLEYFDKAVPYFEKAHVLGETNARGILLGIARLTGNSDLLQRYE